MNVQSKLLRVYLASLPLSAAGKKLLPGSIGWKIGGRQWVPILPVHNRYAMPLGRACVFEEDAAAYADLYFNLENGRVRRWHKKLSRDPVQAGKELKCSFWFSPTDQGGSPYKCVDVCAVSVALGDDSKTWPGSGAKFDLVGGMILAEMKAREAADDDY